MRLTTDTPKNNLEMALNLFYVKDKDVWVRGYGRSGADISLLDLTREILSYQCPYVESDISDDDLIMMMPEWLFDDVRATEHVIGLLYQAAWVCAELREHLKQFEDTGCEPEEVLPKGKADEIMLKLMRLADLESLCSYDRLRELAEADKDGRVVVLPCKVGDTVWRIKRTFEEYPDRSKPYIEPDCFLLQDVFNIGKTVFLTREEAENALQEMEGKQDG